MPPVSGTAPATLCRKPRRLSTGVLTQNVLIGRPGGRAGGIPRAASIPYRDASNRIADFHALRHSFLTRLARSGVAPAVAKSLARHSTIMLTMDHYTHTLIEDERSALDRLPALAPDGQEREAARATGTDDAASAVVSRGCGDSPRTLR